MVIRAVGIYIDMNYNSSFDGGHIIIVGFLLLIEFIALINNS